MVFLDSLKERHLIVAAWEPELARFRERWASSGSHANIVLETVGIGMVDAGLGVMRCIARHKPDRAWLLGTAGAFPCGGAPSIGDVTTASSVRLVDAATAEGASELPSPMPAEVALDGVMHDALVAAGARSVRVANTLGITVDDALAARLAHTGATLEHLEAFAFARACEFEGVRGAIVLGIANVVGALGRAQWRENHTRASASAGDVAWAAVNATSWT